MARVVIRTKDGRELIFHRPPYTAAEKQAYCRAKAHMTGWTNAYPHDQIGLYLYLLGGRGVWFWDQPTPTTEVRGRQQQPSDVPQSRSTRCGR